MTEELQTQGSKDEYDRTALDSGLRRLKKSGTKRGKTFESGNRTKTFCDYKENKLKEKKRCFGYSTS